MDVEQDGMVNDTLHTKVAEKHKNDKLESRDEDHERLLPLHQLGRMEEPCQSEGDIASHKPSDTHGASTDEKEYERLYHNELRSQKYTVISADQEYCELEQNDLSDEVRSSEDEIAWQLPPTVLPEGGLSPF